MKRIGGFTVAIVCITILIATLLYAQSKPIKVQKKDHIRWVEVCLKDFEAIEVGMTRAEVESKLLMDGGLQAASRVRFSHPSCPYFKLNVEFDVKPDSSDKNQADRGKDATAIKISKPYIERPFID